MSDTSILNRAPSAAAASAPATTRFTHLDGLRGLASVAVLLWHNFLAFFPGAVYPDIPMRSVVLEKYLYRSPLTVFFAGDFAVFVFFTLSGFVLTYKYFAGGEKSDLKRGFLRRYVRLMPPALFSILVAYVVLDHGWNYNNAAAAIINSPWLTLNWSEVFVSFRNAIWMGFLGMWFTGISAQAQFNSNLGTLTLELIGSFMVFAYVIVLGELRLSFKARCLTHIFIFLLCIVINIDDPHYLVFFAGVAVADTYANAPGFYAKVAKVKYLLLLVSIYFATANIGNLASPFFNPMDRAFRLFGLHPLSYPWAFGAILLVVSVLTSDRLKRIFSSRVFQILGQYSFALFIAHTMFLCSVTSFAFVQLQPLGLDYRLQVAAAFFGTLPFLLGFTHIIKIIDDWSIKVSRRF